ncbi:A disintegrin and metalloproteinase with thrombospondin motifs 8-like [Sinocyclocheilus rhinocerous]|uniref:A disintegrin and metalloproteinase with thrombospondin motifs 8-like n=1 Tax=Sinocyclocheilus rhinocerous TaxID=307959 RepID=UPI0007B94F6D|nr:PREDICTED: A disintegrin and metalloproteinase with thrombospondin motifs 8-like [Sinocyclocheilus rhinocerous]
MVSTVVCYIFFLVNLMSQLATCELNEEEETVPVNLTFRKGIFWRNEERPRFKINAFGQLFLLDLTPDSRFVSPSLNVQRINAKNLPAVLYASGSGGVFRDVTPSGDSGADLRDCFYKGTVNSDEESVVAVSLCHGIQGTFITQGDEYFIQPKASAKTTSKSFPQVHVVKRRAFSSSSRRASNMIFDQEKVDSFVKKSNLNSSEDKDGKVRRAKRFVSAARYIETLVVADASMTRFYGDEIKHYLLTVMSMAAQIYVHPSLKNAVSLVVVKMVVVEDEEVGPELSSNGGVALRNFCRWQQLFNPGSQRHPEHYDTAILFTREDICGYKDCDTLGVADIGTMCDPKRSCSVIEDNGLQAAFTVSHELGHVLSMPHDDSKICEKLFGHLNGHHMMAPFFIHLNKTLPWSPCSALYITEFFDNGHGDCLLDPPEKSIPLPTELPGRMFGLDRQCQQAFGDEYTHCPNAPEDQACAQLWCREEGKIQCTTRNGSLPWADGTPCGEDRRCREGSCMSSALEEAGEEKVPVNGGWGEWGPWGPGSRTCGGGVEFSHRECTAPVPQNGGSYCVGQRVKYQSCNTQTCPEDHGKSFREEQCEKYNTDRYLDIQGNMKQWIPKYSGVSPRDRCKLVCRAKGSNEFKVFEAKVVDGTTCGPDTTSICVQGQCIKAGCDQVIGSNEKLDKCGICGGDGTNCRKISSSLNKATIGYTDIVTIPAGATNIDIKQRSHRGIAHDGNYLAVKAGDGTYILNGNFSVSMAEQDIPVPGAMLRYSGSSTTLERLLSFHRLREPITIQLLSTAGDTSPPRIKYTFFLPRDVPFSKPGTESRISPHVILPFGGADWVLGEWSECSKSCGAGWSRRSVECRDGEGSLSYLCDADLRPADIRPCGDLPCPMWQMGPWSACSRTCGVGQRHRTVVCMDYTGKILEHEKCNPDKRPEVVVAECFYQDC